MPDGDKKLEVVQGSLDADFITNPNIGKMFIVQGKVQSRLPGEANLIVEKVKLLEMDKEDTERVLQREAHHTEMSKNRPEFSEF